MTFSIRNRAKVQALIKPGYIHWTKLAIWGIIILLVVDALYSAWFGINYHTREKCVIYRFLPKWFFLVYEYLIELFMVVTVGAFAGSILEKHFNRYRRFLPKNQIMAFVYASVIPVCSCSAVPLIESMKHRLPLRSVITFVVAAPLLNPFIMVLSYSVLGFWYGTLRIVGAFLVAMITGWFVEWVYNRSGRPEIGVYKNCSSSACSVVVGQDVYKKTWNMVSKIAPYIFLAGLMGLGFELIGPVKLIETLPLNGNLLSILLITVIGIPIYFCNGAEVLFLAPLLKYTDLGLGFALSFSLSSTAICISSILMLYRFLGRKLTIALVTGVVVTIVLFSLAIGMTGIFRL